MSDDAIKAALEKAELEPSTAGKIAAFLRALPPHAMYWPSREMLAAAVERAARDE